MKMNSLLKSKPKNNTKKVLFISTCVCLFFIGLQYAMPNVIRSTVFTLAKPFWYIRDTTVHSFSSFFAHFETVASLQKQNKILQDEIADLKVKEFEYDQMKVLYEDIRGLVGTSTSSQKIARILSKPPFTPYDIFIVDQGSLDMVRVGDLVYAHNALAIGRVSEVTAHTSFVTLFSSGGQVQEFEVLRTGVSVEVVGKGGGNFELYVPKDFDIVEGDIVSEPTTGLGAVASVYAIDTTSQNSFKRVYARVPESIFQLKFVLIGDM